LHGLVSDNDRELLAIHVHGTWGNFYANTITTAFVPTYASIGADWATVNVPGHDEESTTEVFDDSIPALLAWIDELSRGRDLIFQGHSLGAAKVMRLLTSHPEVASRTRATILISPFDLAAFYADSADDGVRIEKLHAAQAAVADGAASANVDPALFDVWPISNGTYAFALERDTDWDLFPTANGSAGVLAAWEGKTLILLGGDDFAATPDPKSVAEIFGSHAKNAKVELLPRAPHNLAGSEDAADQLIAAFLSN
jgi:hypothetical protein